MNKEKFYLILIVLQVVAIGLTSAHAIFADGSWIVPVSAPGGAYNIDAPINVSTDMQSISGPLKVSTGLENGLSGYGMIITGNTDAQGGIQAQSLASDPPLSSGRVWFTSSVAPASPFSCTGTKPASALECPGDSTFLTSYEPWTHVGVDSSACSATKCEYYTPFALTCCTLGLSTFPCTICP